MYNKIAGSRDIMKSIDGFDLFNSERILLIDNMIGFVSKPVSSNIGRLDLLTKEYYDSLDNYGLLGIFNRIENYNDLSLGKIIKYPNQYKLDTLSESDI